MPIPARVQTVTAPSGVSRWIPSHFVSPSGTHAWATSFDGTIYETDLRTFETRARGRIRQPGPNESLPASALRPIGGERGVLPWPPEQRRASVIPFMLYTADGPRIIAHCIITEPFEPQRVRSTYSLHAIDGTLLRSLTEAEIITLPTQLWPQLRVLVDHSAFSITRSATPNAPAYFDANGDRLDPEPLLIDAFTEQPLRSALSRTLRARIDGDHLVIEDASNGRARSIDLPASAGQTPLFLRARSSSQLVVVLRASQILVDLRDDSCSSVDSPAWIHDASASSILTARWVAGRPAERSTLSLSLIDRASGNERSAPIGDHRALALRGDTTILLHEGQYSTLARDAFDFDQRDCAPMSAVAVLRVSDRGAICAQDSNGQIRWWNEDLSASCASDRWKLDDGAPRDKLLGWAEGQSTLIVRRTHEARTQIIGMAFTDGALLERWSFDTLSFESCAFDETGTTFVTVANNRPHRLCWRTRTNIEPKPRELVIGAAVRQLHLFGDRWLEARAKDQRLLFERIDDKLVLRDAKPTHNTFRERVSIDWPSSTELPVIELGPWTLRPSELDTSLFRLAPDGFTPRATASFRSDNKGPAVVPTRRHLWIDADPLAEDAPSAVAFSPNGRWGAIATRLGHIQRFELPPDTP